MDEYKTDFIGWKLEDISGILSKDAKFEMPLDAPGDWSEPLHGNQLVDYLKTRHQMDIAWSFAVPNPRSRMAEYGTILVGLEVKRSSLDTTVFPPIIKFKQFLEENTEDGDAPNPGLIIEENWEEYPTVPGVWWKN